MNKTQYVFHLKDKMERYAKKNKLKAESDITIDWGEMQFILSFIPSPEDAELNTNIGDDPQILNLLADPIMLHKQNSLLESQQIWDYLCFIREQGLEEAFEYFLHERQKNTSRG